MNNIVTNLMPALRFFHRKTSPLIFFFVSNSKTAIKKPAESALVRRDSLLQCGKRAKPLGQNGIHSIQEDDAAISCNFAQNLIAGREAAGKNAKMIIC